ncbi:LytR/AlgR family response regulator transcription factor [Kineothrix sp. MB12-C1]|uniref:LytR/AlgR family response regulator transcription factor n=1 Tax=Kineothrix sp. MB12-C1 TaxID=3070215 RepID=UPI0027D2CAD6|nr:LytTR family DNA-binding domain-containing protein [Kineothrix sp. MB12-C1]WMC94078.1 LytTR family DNA-binding domain-containing protein [Kineothrix sp. MB12-C1]
MGGLNFMMRIAIVEDEVMYAKQLEGFLHRYEEERQETFDIHLFTDGDEIVENYKAQFDIILLDIQMRFMDGMTTAEAIREVDTEVIIIFITNLRQYAIRGYEVDALDYVVKPISYFAFSERLNRAIKRLKKRTQHTIVIKLRGGIARIDVADIYYVESQNHTLIYHTVGKNIESPGAMKNAEDMLSEFDFYRGNKGYLINLAYVDSVQDGCAVVRGEKLLLSRPRRNGFMEALTSYWGEVK